MKRLVAIFLLSVLILPLAWGQVVKVEVVWPDLPDGWKKANEGYASHTIEQQGSFSKTYASATVRFVEQLFENEEAFRRYYFEQVSEDGKVALFFRHLQRKDGVNEKEAEDPLVAPDETPWNVVYERSYYQSTSSVTVDGYNGWLIRMGDHESSSSPIHKRAMAISVENTTVLVYGMCEPSHCGAMEQVLMNLQFKIKGGDNPERVMIAITNAVLDTTANVVRITGTYKSKSAITSATIFRAMGGPAIQGHLQFANGRFTASCDFFKGVENTFRVVFDNADEKSAEQNVTLSPSGQFVRNTTTGADGNTQVGASVPVSPGLGPVGNIPGPKNLVQGVLGVLGPGVLGILGGWLSGILGGGRVPPPTPPTGGKPPAAPPKPLDPKNKPKFPLQKPDPKGKTTQEKTNGSDKNKPPEKPKKPDKPKPPNDPATQSAQNTLKYVEGRPNLMKDPQIKDLVKAAKESCFTPDGKVIPDKWNAVKEALKNAVNPGPETGSSGIASETIKAIGKTVKDVASEVGGAVKNIGIGIKDGVVAAGKGFKAIGDAVLNPGYFVKGVNESFKNWIRTNAPEAPKQFVDALKEGRYLDAVKTILVTEGKLFGSAIMGIGKGLVGIVKEMLPYEEVKSLFDKNASLEEKLWAVPAAAVKIASLLLPTKYAKTPVPGLGQGTTFIKSANPGLAAAKTAEAAAVRAAQLQKNLTGMEAAAAKQGTSAAAKGGLKDMITQTKKAIEQAQTMANAGKAVQQVENLVGHAGAPSTATANFKAAQGYLNKNTGLRDAIDAAIKADGGGGSLYNLRLNGVMSKDAHTLITARKLQLQEQAINNAVKRALAEEVAALQQKGLPIPKRFFTANSTEGSRVAINGSNAACDLDQTVLGMKHVRATRMNQILQEECKNLGFSQKTLDTNIYTPRPGKLMDAKGPAPNSESWLVRSLQREPGRSGFHQVHVTRDGRVIVGDHVTAQGKSVLPVHQQMGRPTILSTAEKAASVKSQLGHVIDAAKQNNLNQMVKYGARAIKDGHQVDTATYNLVMKVASQKDPHAALELLKSHGVNNANDLIRRLNLPKHLATH